VDHSAVIETVSRLAEPLCREFGLELVAVQFRREAVGQVLRVVIFRPEGVTVDDCARVSRGLERWLDAHPAMPERYVLEVSSPGVERPLTRRKDWIRFVGHTVLVRGQDLPSGSGGRLEGELLGLREVSGEDRVRLRLPDGEEVEVPLQAVAGAHLVHRWG